MNVLRKLITSVPRHRFCNISRRSFSFIGQGFYNTEFRPIIHKTILENPDWYTAYTSYQSEISQGRLTLLYQYQNMIKMFTGMDLANAGLLDHAHCLFEAIQMSIKVNNKIENPVILVDKNLYENHKHTLSSYQEHIWSDKNVIIIFVDFVHFDVSKLLSEDLKIIGCVVQSVDKFGYYQKDYKLIDELKSEMKNQNINMITTVSCDLMHHTVLKSPKYFGANIAVGNLQRLGIPLFGGGPHSCFFACDKELIRLLPGKLVTDAKDKYDNLCYRMALQTREQHIKREKANSNICTNQNLFNLYATTWLMNIGVPNFTKKMNSVINCKTNNFYPNNTFDTVLYTSDTPHKDGYFTGNRTIFTLDDINIKEISKLKKLSFLEKIDEVVDTTDVLNENEYKRVSPIKRDEKNHLFFDLADDPLELMRYLNRLQKQDFSLLSGMIPLGSCTMKYNPVETLKEFSNESYLNLHPYSINFNKNYITNIRRLIAYLKSLTGFSGCSIQPLSGAHSELMALCMIKKYFKLHNQEKRKYIFIPESAHGTNPCSASIAGFEVISLKQTQSGYLDYNYFHNIIENMDKKTIAGSMITYPNTYGIFDHITKEVNFKIKEMGGFTYMDGANMNAWIGRLHPKDIGFDIMHINMHKTLAIPHGGGGPGMGALCCNEELDPYLPNAFTHRSKYSIGQLSNTVYGNSLAGFVSLHYMKNIAGSDECFNPISFSKISSKTVENANYVVTRIDQAYSIPFRDRWGKVAHEFIINCDTFKKYGITSNHIAKRLIDYSLHPPTMNWPLPNSLMIEVTETENQYRMEYLIDSLLQIKEEIVNNPSILKNAPHSFTELLHDNWKFPYTKLEAFYPLGERTKVKKFIPMISDINEAESDRKLLR